MTNKISIITGANSGIGRALATDQARQGITVISADIDGEAAARTAKACGNGSWSAALV